MSWGDNVTLQISGVGSWSAMLPTDLRLLKPRPRTDLLELCLARAVEWFIQAYMPLRFNPGYAASELGYYPTNSTIRRKKDESFRYHDAVLPNVWHGATRKAALETSHVQTVAIGGRTSGAVRARIVMVLPGYVNQQSSQLTNKTLRKITPREGERIAKRFFQEITTASANIVTEVTQTREGKIFSRSAIGSEDAAQIGRTSRSTIIMQRKSAMAEARSA